jgi:hypothetical protein
MSIEEEGAQRAENGGVLTTYAVPESRDNIHNASHNKFLFQFTHFFTSKCDALRPDLPICHSYMEAYMERVKDWADRHGELMVNQYPKVCTLQQHKFL